MIQSFKDIKAWQLAIELSVQIYSITKQFPQSELFGLTNQLRRASVSVSSNIAEGFGRKNNKEKDYFYAIAYGSLLEVESQLILANKLKMHKQLSGDSVFDTLSEAQKVLSGLRRSNLKKGAS